MLVRPPCDEAVSQSAPVGTPCPRAAEPWILAATILGSSMVFIDGAVVNLALPVLQDDLGATVVELQWFVEAYALTLAALLLVGGSLGDHFGRRRIFAIGVGLFALASAACGLAQNAQQLIAARALQGVAGALLTPGQPGNHRGGVQRRPAWPGHRDMVLPYSSGCCGGPCAGWMVDPAGLWRWVFFLICRLP